MEFQVSLAPKAERDLEEIGRYIALEDDEAARRVCGKLLEAAQSLHDFPRRGSRMNFREVYRLVHGSYLIFYKIDDEARRIEVLRFWHAAQNPRRLRLREASPVYGTAPAVAGA